MVIFTAWAKIYSAKYICNAQKGGQNICPANFFNLYGNIYRVSLSLSLFLSLSLSLPPSHLLKLSIFLIKAKLHISYRLIPVLEKCQLFSGEADVVMAHAQSG